MNKKLLEQFAEFPIPSYGQWREVTEKSLKGATFEKHLITQTYEEISLQPMYRREDIEKLTTIQSLPGKSPFLRGNNPISVGWEINQEILAATPSQFNKIAREDLQRGQTSLNIVLDSPTKAGLEPTEAPKSVGVTGLSLSSLEDIAIAFNQIDLTTVPLHLHCGENSLPIFTVICAYVETLQQNSSRLSGAIGMDPLGELISKGKLYYTLEDCFKNMATVTGWASIHAPMVKTVLIHGDVYHNGGSSAVEELAFAIATGVEYLQALVSRGIEINTAARHVRFVFAIGSNFFMEIAKLRAARTLWAAIVKEFGGNEMAQKMDIHARTSAWTKTIYDPYVNMLRGTSEAFAAVVGGANSIHVSPFDEAIQKPTAFSRRIARNVGIILNEEAHLAKTTDPVGGSWYVETLTKEVSEKAWSLFQKTEEIGGIVEALKQSFPQNTVKRTAQKRERSIQHRRDKIIGTNMYVNLFEKQVDNELDETVEIENHIKACTQRSRISVKQLETIENGINSAKQGATIGQLSTMYKKTTKPIVSIEPIVQTRASINFEDLRRRAKAYQEKTGKSLTVFLATIGEVSEYKARADFASGFFEVGGFHIIRSNGSTSQEDNIKEAIDAFADVTVICGNDQAYKEQAVSIVTSIKSALPNTTVLLAGKPHEEEQNRFKHAGVSDFVYLGSNCYEMLYRLQVQKGVVE